MFYSTQILARKGPLGLVWMAAHMDRGLKRNQVHETSISSTVDVLLSPEAPLALRLSGQLLLGVCRIYARKVSYLLEDCQDALVKIRLAFRPEQLAALGKAAAAAAKARGKAGAIAPDMAAQTALPEAITLHDGWDELQLLAGDDIELVALQPNVAIEAVMADLQAAVASGSLGGGNGSRRRASMGVSLGAVPSQSGTQGGFSMGLVLAPSADLTGGVTDAGGGAVEMEVFEDAGAPLEFDLEEIEIERLRAVSGAEAASGGAADLAALLGGGRMSGGGYSRGGAAGEGDREEEVGSPSSGLIGGLSRERESAGAAGLSAAARRRRSTATAVAGRAGSAQLGDLLPDLDMGGDGGGLNLDMELALSDEQGGEGGDSGDGDENSLGRGQHGTSGGRDSRQNSLGPMRSTPKAAEEGEDSPLTAMVIDGNGNGGDGATRGSTGRGLMLTAAMSVTEEQLRAAAEALYAAGRVDPYDLPSEEGDQCSEGVEAADEADQDAEVVAEAGVGRQEEAEAQDGGAGEETTSKGGPRAGASRRGSVAAATEQELGAAMAGPSSAGPTDMDVDSDAEAAPGEMDPRSEAKSKRTTTTSGDRDSMQKSTPGPSGESAFAGGSAAVTAATASGSAGFGGYGGGGSGGGGLTPSASGPRPSVSAPLCTGGGGGFGAATPASALAEGATSSHGSASGVAARSEGIAAVAGTGERAASQVLSPPRRMTTRRSAAAAAAAAAAASVAATPEAEVAPGPTPSSDQGGAAAGGPDVPLAPGQKDQAAGVGPSSGLGPAGTAAAAEPAAEGPTGGVTAGAADGPIGSVAGAAQPPAAVGGRTRAVKVRQARAASQRRVQLDQEGAMLPASQIREWLQDRSELLDLPRMRGRVTAAPASPAAAAKGDRRPLLKRRRVVGAPGTLLTDAGLAGAMLHCAASAALGGWHLAGPPLPGAAVAGLKPVRRFATTGADAGGGPSGRQPWGGPSEPPPSSVGPPLQALFRVAVGQMAPHYALQMGAAAAAAAVAAGNVGDLNVDDPDGDHHDGPRGRCRGGVPTASGSTSWLRHWASAALPQQAVGLAGAGTPAAWVGGAAGGPAAPGPGAAGSPRLALSQGQSEGRAPSASVGGLRYSQGLAEVEGAGPSQSNATGARAGVTPERSRSERGLSSGASPSQDGGPLPVDGPGGSPRDELLHPFPDPDLMDEDVPPPAPPPGLDSADGGWDDTEAENEGAGPLERAATAAGTPAGRSLTPAAPPPPPPSARGLTRTGAKGGDRGGALQELQVDSQGQIVGMRRGGGSGFAAALGAGESRGRFATGSPAGASADGCSGSGGYGGGDYSETSSDKENRLVGAAAVATGVTPGGKRPLRPLAPSAGAAAEVRPSALAAAAAGDNGAEAAAAWEDGAMDEQEGVVEGVDGMQEDDPAALGGYQDVDDQALLPLPSSGGGLASQQLPTPLGAQPAISAGASGGAGVGISAATPGQNLTGRRALSAAAVDKALPGTSSQQRQQLSFGEGRAQQEEEGTPLGNSGGGTVGRSSGLGLGSMMRRPHRLSHWTGATPAGEGEEEARAAAAAAAEGGERDSPGATPGLSRRLGSILENQHLRPHPSPHTGSLHRQPSLLRHHQPHLGSGAAAGGGGHLASPWSGGTLAGAPGSGSGGCTAAGGASGGGGYGSGSVPGSLARLPSTSDGTQSDYSGGSGLLSRTLWEFDELARMAAVGAVAAGRASQAGPSNEQAAHDDDLPHGLELLRQIGCSQHHLRQQLPYISHGCQHDMQPGNKPVGGLQAAAATGTQLPTQPQPARLMMPEAAASLERQQQQEGVTQEATLPFPTALTQLWAAGVVGGAGGGSQEAAAACGATRLTDLTCGRGRRDAARCFYDMLVLKNRGLVDLYQRGSGGPPPGGDEVWVTVTLRGVETASQRLLTEHEGSQE